MTKEITKANLLQEMQDKFKLRELVPEVFAFSEMVVPVYDINLHLAHHEVAYWEISITGTGSFIVVTVPQNERWSFTRYDVIFMGAGAYTVSGLILRRIHGTPDSVYLDLEAAQSVSYHIQLPTEIIAESGDKLLMVVDGFTSTQDLRVYLDYKKEEIR